MLLGIGSMVPIAAQTSEPTAAPVSHFRILPGLRLCGPEIVSASATAAFRETPGWKGGEFWIAKLEAGLAGGRVAFGRAFTSDVGLGAEANAFVLRTWGNPWGVRPNGTYAGLEVSLILLARVSAGVMYRSNNGSGGSRWAATWGLGIGL